MQSALEEIRVPRCCFLLSIQQHTFTSLSTQPWNACFMDNGSLDRESRLTPGLPERLRGPRVTGWSYSPGKVENRAEWSSATKKVCKMEGQKYGGSLPAHGFCSQVSAPEENLDYPACGWSEGRGLHRGVTSQLWFLYSPVIMLRDHTLSPRPHLPGLHSLCSCK